MSKTYHWMADQVVYEIFPDRFEIGQPNTTETKLKLPSYHRIPEYTRLNWSERPPNPSKGFDFFGGDLQGIIDRISHLEMLGVTTLFLTPIFLSTSNHKYESEDFTIDEQFGDEDILKKLIQELHRRGMRLFMDAVLNHVRDSHRWFRYAQKGLQPYKDYFKFHPDGSFECWNNHKHMPELNLSNQELANIIYRKPNSVLQEYLNMGVDGIRLDAANDVGMGVIRDIRKTLADRFPGVVLIGEVANYAGDWIDTENGYHGVMNYYFHSALYSWLAGDITSLQMNYTVDEYSKGYGEKGAVYSWNILSSHDTARSKNLLPEEAARNLAIIAQFTLPGVPFIYYGEEIGMEGGPDPDCRRPMIWDESRWDMATLTLYKKLIGIRKSHRELREGKYMMLGHKMRSDVLAFLRYTQKINEVALVVLNRSSDELREKLFIPHSHLYDGLPLKDLLSSHLQIKMQKGNVDLVIPGRSAVILVPDDMQIPNYRFYKPRNLGE